jgi:glycosyltransferase involved in cell wall biosynthesis
MLRLAFIISHPIQYYAPLHRRLAQREDVAIKVFFTWHAGTQAQLDHGFQKVVAWDLPLTEGYEYEVVPNIAQNPGTHHFWGLRNPSLVEAVLAWQPDAVHVTGYAFASHLHALHALPLHGVPVLFRGDSHLLGERRSGWQWQLKRSLLHAIYKWPSGFLCVGQANGDYYRAFGVPENKAFYCPHSVEVERFAEPEAEHESAARIWKTELGIPEDVRVLLFAGKFEDKKRPLPLMNAFLKCALPKTMLLMVGDGDHGESVRELAVRHPERFRVLPFQNQSRMPMVYRLADWLVLPSAYGETWGLAVNEAMACGRPALVSDRVGCQADLIRSGMSGEVFRADDWADFARKLASIQFSGDSARRQEIKKWAKNWSVERTEKTLLKAARALVAEKRPSNGR